MRSALLLVALLVGGATLPIATSPAAAAILSDDSSEDPCATTSSAGATAATDGLNASIQAGSDCTHPTKTLSFPPGHWHTTRVCALGGLVTCLQQAKCPDGTPETDRYYLTTTGSRLYDSDSCGTPATAPTLTTGRIVEAFRHLPLPGAPLMIQPSRGWTLVNLDTIFYTTTTTLNRRIGLLHHRIDFRITARGYTWHFGDGHQIYTTTPGRPFTTIAAIKSDITHRYLLKDTYHPRVDVTYGATFRVDGGRWRPVNGTVEIQGITKDLTARTATPHLTG